MGFRVLYTAAVAEIRVTEICRNKIFNLMFVTRNSNGFLVTYSQNSSVSVVTELRAGRMDLDF